MPRIFYSLKAFTRHRKALRSEKSRSKTQKTLAEDKSSHSVSVQTTPLTAPENHNSKSMPVLEEIEHSSNLSMGSLERFSNLSVRSFDPSSDDATRTYSINTPVDHPSNHSITSQIHNPLTDDTKKKNGDLILPYVEEQDKFGDWFEDDEAHCGKCGGYWWKDDKRYKHYSGERILAEQLAQEQLEVYKCNRCGHLRNRTRKVVVWEPGPVVSKETEVMPTGATVTKHTTR